MAKDTEMNLISKFSKRLEQTEKEIGRLEPAQQKRVKDYLFSRFGWFARTPVQTEIPPAEA